MDTETETREKLIDLVNECNIAAEYAEVKKEFFCHAERCAVVPAWDGVSDEPIDITDLDAAFARVKSLPDICTWEQMERALKGV